MSNTLLLARAEQKLMTGWLGRTEPAIVALSLNSDLFHNMQVTSCLTVILHST